MPAPGVELLRGDHSGNDRADRGGQQHAGRDPELREGAELATGIIGRVFNCHQCRAAPLATGGEVLDDAQEDQENRCPDANACVGRQQAHQHQDDDQYRSAAVLVRPARTAWRHQRLPASHRPGSSSRVGAWLHFRKWRASPGNWLRTVHRHCDAMPGPYSRALAGSRP